MLGTEEIIRVAKETPEPFLLLSLLDSLEEYQNNRSEVNRRGLALICSMVTIRLSNPHKSQEEIVSDIKGIEEWRRMFKNINN